MKYDAKEFGISLSTEYIKNDTDLNNLQKYDIVVPYSVEPRILNGIPAICVLLKLKDDPQPCGYCGDTLGDSVDNFKKNYKLLNNG